MKFKQFNHLWNEKDSKNSSQSFPRPPRIIGQKRSIEQIESLNRKRERESKCNLAHLSFGCSSNEWSQGQRWRKEGKNLLSCAFQNLPAVWQIPYPTFKTVKSYTKYFREYFRLHPKKYN